MKNIYFSFLVLILSASCSKNESPQTPRAQNIQADINGVFWSAEVTSWASSGGSQQINTSPKSDGSLMQIFLPLDTTGTFDASDNVITVAYNDGADMFSNNVSGTVVLNQNSSERIEGTFNLKIASYFNSDTLELTNGSFYWSR